MLIGEAPGEEEKKTGKVFMGRGGRLQSNMLEFVGIDEVNDCFLTNVVLCHPEGNADPTPEQLKACAGNLEAAINQVKPKVLLPLGRFALKQITGKTGITKWSGMVLESKFGIPAIPILHPAGALHQGAQESEDLNNTSHPVVLKILRDLEFAKHFIENGAKEVEVDTSDREYIIAKTWEDRTLEDGTVERGLEYVFKKCRDAPRIVVDLETTGLIPHRHKIIGICFSWGEKIGCYIPLLVKLEDLPRKKIDTSNLTPIKLLAQKLKGIDEEQGDAARWIEKEDTDKKSTRLGVYRYWRGDHDKVLNRIKAIVGDHRKELIGQNFKFDYKMILYHWGVEANGFFFDDLYASYLLDENSPRGLKDNADLYFPDLRGYANTLHHTLKRTDFEGENYGDLPIDIIGPYGCGDGDASFRLSRLFSAKMEKESDRYQWYMENFYVPMSKNYGRMELRGAKIDIPWCTARLAEDTIESEQLRQEVCHDIYTMTLARIEQAVITLEEDPNQPELQAWLEEATIFITHGVTQSLRVRKLPKFKSQPDPLFLPGNIPNVNFNSDRQFPHALFNMAGVKVNPDYITKTGLFSTSKEAMKWYTERWPLCEKVTTWRNRKKMESTYYVGFQKDLMPGDRCTYTFRFDAVTGRLKAKEVPIHGTPRNPRVRGMIIPEPGKILVEIDYSMVELRYLSYYSQDPVMLDELARGVDLHKATAAMTYKCTVEEVNKAQRKKAKGMNFGAWYGGGDKRLASNINSKLEEGEQRITPQEVAEFRRNLFHKYHVTADYVEWKTDQIRKNGYTISCYGRKRRVPQTLGDDRQLIEEGVREGFNADIQGSASDSNQLSLIEFWKILDGEATGEEHWWKSLPKEITPSYIEELRHGNSWPLFTVHDSQVWEFVLRGLLAWTPVMFPIMENPLPPIDIKTPVEFKIYKERWGGDNWEIKSIAELNSIVDEVIEYFTDQFKDLDPRYLEAI